MYIKIKKKIMNEFRLVEIGLVESTRKNKEIPTKIDKLIDVQKENKKTMKQGYVGLDYQNGELKK